MRWSDRPSTVTISFAPANMSEPTSTATGIRWNLSDLYRSVDDPQIEKDMAVAEEQAQAFEGRYRGKITGATAELLRDAVQELEALS
jgi:oligoendopeptidase F